MVKPSAECVRSVLHYDDQSGVFTRTKRTSNYIQVGDVAGTKRPDGYIKIHVLGKQYYAHHLAWLYVHGVWPDGEIDHANRNPSDNSIANLRLATRSLNCSNTKLRADNTSGIKGVAKYSQRGKPGRWRAFIRHDGRSIHLGMFDTADAAAAAYSAKAKELFGIFANVEGQWST